MVKFRANTYRPRAVSFSLRCVSMVFLMYLIIFLFIFATFNSILPPNEKLSVRSVFSPSSQVINAKNNTGRSHLWIWMGTVTNRSRTDRARYTQFAHRARRPSLIGNFVPIIQPLNETRETVSIIQDKFKDDNLVTIRGFYSSGTNWLRKLFSKNCARLLFMKIVTPPLPPNPKRISLDADGLYGWKHGLFLHKELDKFTSRPNHKMVIISREAPTWLVSAWKMNAMVRGIVPPPVVKDPKTGKVIPPKASIYTKIEEYVKNVAVNETGVPGEVYMQKYYDSEIRAAYQLKADNVMDARNKVYKNWMPLLSVPEIASRVSFVRYEDFLADPYMQFEKVVRDLQLPCSLAGPSRFDTVQDRVKYGLLDKKAEKPQQRHPRAEFCKVVTTEQLYTDILAKVDQDFERRFFRYEYPPTRENYCQGALPTSPAEVF
jgi:hypothetical protein